MDLLRDQPQTWREYAILMPALLVVAAAGWYFLGLVTGNDLSWAYWAFLMVCVAIGAAIRTARRVRQGKG